MIKTLCRLGFPHKDMNCKMKVKDGSGLIRVVCGGLSVPEEQVLSSTEGHWLSLGAPLGLGTMWMLEERSPVYRSNEFMIVRGLDRLQWMLSERLLTCWWNRASLTFTICSNTSLIIVGLTTWGSGDKMSCIGRRNIKWDNEDLRLGIEPLCFYRQGLKISSGLTPTMHFRKVRQNTESYFPNKGSN